MKDRGSLAILIAGYLGLLLTLFLGGFAVAIGLVAQNRIQGVTDSVLLYAHDRAVTKGIPNLAKLESAIDTFLSNAPSGKQLEVISLDTAVNGVKSWNPKRSPNHSALSVNTAAGIARAYKKSRPERNQNAGSNHLFDSAGDSAVRGIPIPSCSAIHLLTKGIKNEKTTYL